jgi:hypothetical protein
MLYEVWPRCTDLVYKVSYPATDRSAAGFKIAAEA